MFGLATVLLAGCGDPGVGIKDPPAAPSGPSPTLTAPTPTALPDFEPAPATAHRLTDTEWRNSVEDLFGIRFEGTLPVDYSLHGYVRVGASELTVSPLDMELYEAAAWQIAATVAPNVDAGRALLGCEPDHTGCVRAYGARVAWRAWRRPPDAEELDGLEALYVAVRDQSNEVLGVQAVVSAILQSPAFLFRIEQGVPDPADPSRRRFSDEELAGRLASFLTASVPDAPLLEAAAGGALTAPGGLREHAQRLIQTERGREALASFFAETMELDKLDTVTKDAQLYPAYTEGLRAEMAGEIRLLFKDVALDRGADLGELLTTERAFVGPELAALYGLGPVSGPTEVTLPAAQERGGILGRAAVATIHSHNTLTSPTHRGKFIRGRLLCQSIPPPPPGIVADLDAIDGEGTLRDRLSQHADDPACSGCHDAMDPLGYPLEHFDPIGQRRELDNGLPIDASGELDGITFVGAAGMGAAVAEHEDFPGCMALQLYRHAGGQAERLEELIEVDAVTGDFVDQGRRFEALVLSLIDSDLFLTATAPLAESCDEPGATRPCATACGTGEERCADGAWRQCSAPAPDVERCNGLDDDCDGTIDEALEASCALDDVWGTQSCEAGDWGACATPSPPEPEPVDPVEVCNGLDDDSDGAVDEELEIAIATMSHADLTISHYACDMAIDPTGGPCRAAMHRACAATSCAVTGTGPIDRSASSSDVVCLDASEGSVQQTTYTELSLHHYGCTDVVRIGPACNAAISRFCASVGLVTGLGPIENAGDDATVVCTPQATTFDTSYLADLAPHDPLCDGSAERMGPACNRAMHGFCQAQGFETGHGPLENSGDLAVVACMGVL